MTSNGSPVEPLPSLASGWWRWRLGLLTIPAAILLAFVVAYPPAAPWFGLQLVMLVVLILLADLVVWVAGPRIFLPLALLTGALVVFYLAVAPVMGWIAVFLGGLWLLVAGPWATRIWEHPGVLRLVVSELLTLAVGFGAYMMMVGVGFGEGMAALRIVFPPASVAALLASHTLASFVGTDGRKKAHWLQPSEVEAAGQRALASWRPIAIIARRTPRGRTARTQYAVLATVLGVVGFAAIGQAVTSDSADVPAGYMVSVVAFASAIGVGALAVFPFLPGWWAAPITVVSIPAAAVLTPAVLAPLALLELVAAAWQPPWRDDEPPRGGDR